MKRAQLPHYETFVVGAFPPPMGGAAKNTKIIYDELAARSTRTLALSTSTDKLAHNRSFIYHVRRLIKNTNVLLRILYRVRPGTSLYTVPDGGLGAWYTLAHIVFARLLGARIFIHHRTFKYIDSWSPAAAAFTQVSKSNATHVFLSPEMGRRFQSRYGPVSFLVASNARFIKVSTKPPIPASSVVHIGHLSNLCKDKGFFETCDAFENCINGGLECSLVLAGPVLEKAVQERLDELRSAYGEKVAYLGPISGDEKHKFYEQIDVFVFPTQFDLEAQPNVIYEAFSYGKPVATTDRGCIREMVPDFAGIVVSKELSFSESLISFLRSEAWRPSACSELIRSHVKNEFQDSEISYKILYNLILDGGARLPRPEK